MRRIRNAALLLAALALSACGLFPSAQEKAEARQPAFKQGYSDGCAAASTTGVNPRDKTYRDEAQYRTNHAYRAGWSSGLSSCRNPNQGDTPGSPLDNRVMNPSPGH